MAIDFPQFNRISFDEANPYITGLGKGQDLAQKFMMFPQDLQSKMLANQIAKVQAQYAKPMAEQGLIKQQQENKYNPQRWQSQMDLQHAQTGRIGKETDWYDQEAKARIGLQQAETQGKTVDAEMNKLKLDYLRQLSAPMGEGQGGRTPSNTVYGIETPKLTHEDIANKMFLGTDTFSPRMQNAKQQQQDQYGQYQKETASAIQEANSAQKAKQVLSMFNNAMNHAYYKGPTLGNMPSSGWKTAFVKGDLKNEQIADNAIANLLPGAITELREAMKTGQFSVADLNASSQMKVSRTMSDAARANQTAWLNGVYSRFDEKAKFYTSMGNPQSGAKKIDADMLWEQYQQQFPLINEKGNEYQGQNIGNWPLFTTPKAIASVQQTGSYKPSSAERNTFMMKLPSGEIVPIKKGSVENAFRKGARPVS